MKFLIVFAALILAINGQQTTTTAKPTLPPELQEKVCRDLIPLHPGSQGPQNTTAPYKIYPSTLPLRNGQFMNITIVPTTPGGRFNGFMVQARNASNYLDYKLFGQWFDDGTGLNDAQSCIGANDTAFSDSPESWDKVTLTWQAPATGSGEVTFFASITQTFTVYWIDLFSEYPVRYGP